MLEVEHVAVLSDFFKWFQLVSLFTSNVEGNALHSLLLKVFHCNKGNFQIGGRVKGFATVENLRRTCLMYPELALLPVLPHLVRCHARVDLPQVD